MEQELTYKKIGIIGCGASGGFASVLLSKNPYIKVFAFDVNNPFSTLLPTGGGRCNLSYDEDDISEFVKNYPRGSKFLLSVFSKFDKEKTINLFNDLSIKTYVQEDKRIFPVSNSSKQLINDLSKHLNTNNFKHIKQNVSEIEKKDGRFIVKTSNGEFEFEDIIISTGGKGNGFELARKLGHNIISPVPSLCALDIKEKYLYNLSGLSFKNVEIKINNKKYPICTGDVLFTHNSISGPCIFKVSALCAFDDFNEQNPLELNLKLTDLTYDEIEEIIKTNSKKTIKNVFSKTAPESYINEIIKINNIEGEKQTAQMNKKEKEIMIKSVTELKIHAVSRKKGSEIVSAGGIDLNEINPKTMESKLVKGLYFIGEILNIDGYTGGFNLQNCWSTAFNAYSEINMI